MYCFGAFTLKLPHIVSSSAGVSRIDRVHLAFSASNWKVVCSNLASVLLLHSDLGDECGAPSLLGVSSLQFGGHLNHCVIVLSDLERLRVWMDQQMQNAVFVRSSLCF